MQAGTWCVVELNSCMTKRLGYKQVMLCCFVCYSLCWGTDRFASLGAVIRYVPMNAHDVTLGRHCSQSLASTSVMFIFIYVYIHIYAIGIHDSYWTDGDENETPRCFYPNCLRLTVLILLIIYPIDFFYSELSLRIYVCFSS